MNAMHTPGPWSVDGVDEIYLDQINITAHDGQVFVAAAIGGQQVGIHEANARLIAAAPDMLAALIAIAEFIPNTSATEGGAAKFSANVKAADMVRAAIAKVTAP